MKHINSIAMIILSVILAALLLSGCKGETMKKDIVIIETSKGNIEVELDRAHSSITVDNFLKYADEGYYNGTVFHRVMKGFMIQGGGFTPNGDQKKTRAPIKLESNNGLKNTVGTLAMARTSVPDSATAQFFISTVDNGFLDYAPGAGKEGYAVFGKVISGMEIVKEIENVQTEDKGPYQNWPVEDQLIMSITRK